MSLASNTETIKNDLARNIRGQHWSLVLDWSVLLEIEHWVVLIRLKMTDFHQSVTPLASLSVKYIPYIR